MARPQKAITFVVADDGCHVCTSHSPFANGYPYGVFEGQRTRMSRALYQKEHGALPKSVVVRHTCDNPLCINLDHLVPGTHADNMRDMAERGRAKAPRGESAPSAKLTWADVEVIRASKEKRKVLAKRYGVCSATIRNVIVGRCWQERQE